MAWIKTKTNGSKSIEWEVGPGNRATLALGTKSKTIAGRMLTRVERLRELVGTGMPMDDETIKWLGSLSDTLHGRIVVLGLASPRAAAQIVTLSALMEAFFAAVSVKAASLVRMKQARANLESHFKPTRNVATITDADAEDWRTAFRAKYSQATTSRTVRYARQFFIWGIKRQLVKSNPFASVKAGTQSNASRSATIDRATIRKVIEAAPDHEWRLLIALGRFAGLRTPSESLLLRWSDIDWVNRTMNVRSPKTEHHEGKAERLVPIDAELLPYLRDSFDLATNRADAVITLYRVGANINPQFHRIIKRSGVAAWPRAWHNLRASRQNELSRLHPGHVVCAWMGNSRTIADEHYNVVTADDVAKATSWVQSGVQSGSSSGSSQTNPGRSASVQNVSQVPVNSTLTHSGDAACIYPNKRLMGRAGLEPATPAFSMRCSTN